MKRLSTPRKLCVFRHDPPFSALSPSKSLLPASPHFPFAVGSHFCQLPSTRCCLLRFPAQLPRWGDSFALEIRPDEIEEWLCALALANPTREKIRRIMNVVYRRGQKSDVRTTQDILRHSSSATTLDLYTQSPMAQRIAAQESVLNAILKQPTRRATTRARRFGSRARLRRRR